MRMAHKLRFALCGVVLLLGGCGGLLGGGGSADMYRFGSLPVADTQSAPPEAARPVLVLFVGSNFEGAVDSDRILTVTGSQAAYVAGARWISPASELFDAATIRAFEQRAPSARLVRLRGSPLPEYALGVDVRRFEADYVAGAEAPPEIVIEARVRLMRWSDRTLIAEFPVVSREPAMENRVATIVDGFDRGTATVVARIADLTQEALARNPSLAMGDASRN
jgi:cholesterol transport system auxiliary component